MSQPPSASSGEAGASAAAGPATAAAPLAGDAALAAVKQQLTQPAYGPADVVAQFVQPFELVQALIKKAKRPGDRPEFHSGPLAVLNPAQGDRLRLNDAGTFCFQCKDRASGRCDMHGACRGPGLCGMSGCHCCAKFCSPIYALSSAGSGVRSIDVTDLAPPPAQPDALTLRATLTGGATMLVYVPRAALQHLFVYA